MKNFLRILQLQLKITKNYLVWNMINGKKKKLFKWYFLGPVIKEWFFLEIKVKYKLSVYDTIVLVMFQKIWLQYILSNGTYWKSVCWMDIFFLQLRRHIDSWYRTDKKGKRESNRFKWCYSKAITIILECLLLSSVCFLVGASRNWFKIGFL